MDIDTSRQQPQQYHCIMQQQKSFDKSSHKSLYIFTNCYLSNMASSVNNNPIAFSLQSNQQQLHSIQLAIRALIVAQSEIESVKSNRTIYQQIQPYYNYTTTSNSNTPNTTATGTNIGAV